MPKQSAGILLFRRRDKTIEVLLVHPGGPFWRHKDLGSWSIPKGEFDPSEEPLAAARREFREETGIDLTGNPIPLQPLKQPGGKIIHAWAVEQDCDASAIRSNTFSMEWPKGSGKQVEFPEVDRAEWFSLDEAGLKILKGQVGFLEQLAKITDY